MAQSILYDEKSLLHSLAEGSELAFTELFTRYRDSIYSTALQLSGSKVTAEEIVQDVFLAFWLQRDKATQIEYLKTYLHRMAANMIFDALKKAYNETKKRQQTGLLDAEYRTPDVLLEHKDYTSLLERAIMRLPEKQRLAYILIRQQGLSREAAAQQLQVTPETIKSNLDLALRSIRSFCLSHLGLSAGIALLLSQYRN